LISYDDSDDSDDSENERQKEKERVERENYLADKRDDEMYSKPSPHQLQDEALERGVKEEEDEHYDKLIKEAEREDDENEY